MTNSNVNTGTICSILCRDLISGYDDDVKETSSIPKWILSSSLIRGGLRNSSEENVQSMNDLSSLLVPSGVLKKIWNSHPCLHVASFEVVHTVWSLSFSIFDLKSILSDSKRKKHLGAGTSIFGARDIAPSIVQALVIGSRTQLLVTTTSTLESNVRRLCVCVCPMDCNSDAWSLTRVRA